MYVPIIRNSTVLGSVKSEGKDFEIRGGIVFGSVEAKGAAAIRINSAADIRGGVFGTENVESVTIEGGSSLWGGLSVAGCLGSITIVSSTLSSVFAEGVAVELNINNNSTILGGLTLTKSAGALSVSSSSVGAGGVLVSESGAVSVSNSAVDSSFIVEKGNGATTFTCATRNAAPGDISVKERTGNVLIEGCAVSDLGVELVVGDVMLKTITTDIDLSISQTDGTISISDSAFGSDANIIVNTGAVTITNSSFDLESVEIGGNGGIVTMTNNIDFGGKIAENGGVCFFDNSSPTSNVDFIKNDCLSQDRNDFASLFFDLNGGECNCA